MDSDSEDMQPESEEGDSTQLNPYPLEDKYTDELDRQKYVLSSHHCPLRTPQAA